MGINKYKYRLFFNQDFIFFRHETGFVGTSNDSRNTRPFVFSIDNTIKDWHTGENYIVIQCEFELKTPYTEEDFEEKEEEVRLALFEYLKEYVKNREISVINLKQSIKTLYKKDIRKKVLTKLIK